MIDELKPCPFCGGEAHHYEYEYDSGVVDYSVCCNDEMACNAAITSDSRDGAIKVWNTRTLTPTKECANEMREILLQIQIRGGLGVSMHKRIDKVLSKLRESL